MMLKLSNASLIFYENGCVCIHTFIIAAFMEGKHNFKVTRVSNSTQLNVY